MASIYDLKPAFQGLLRPVVRALAGAGVTANQVTSLAFLLSVALGAAVAAAPERRGLVLLIPLWMFLRMALNAIAGLLAREHDMKTPLGALLNEVTDVLADAALMLPFALMPGVSGPLVVVAVVLAGATEMMGAVAVHIGASRRYDGPMGKSDRAAAFGVLALLLGGGLAPGLWTTLYLGAVVALVALTVVQRGRRALAEVSP